MAVSRGGITREQAFKNIHMFDAKGLVHKDRKDLFEFNKPYMHENVPGVKTPLDGVKAFKATTIIGVSGCPGLITKDIVEAMCENTEFPCVFPLSNPTSKAECTPHQAYTWSKGKALCATGSPFPEEMVNGHKYVTAQSNNSWIFPAVGFALVTTKARHCPGKVFEVAAEALASLVKPEDHAEHNLLPPLDKIRDYSFGIALKVAEYLIKEELATALPPKGVSLEQWMKPQLFNPTAEYDKIY